MLEKLLLAVSVTFAANLLLGTPFQAASLPTEALPWQQASVQQPEPPVSTGSRQQNF